MNDINAKQEIALILGTTIIERAALADENRQLAKQLNELKSQAEAQIEKLEAELASAQAGPVSDGATEMLLSR